MSTLVGDGRSRPDGPSSARTTGVHPGVLGCAVPPQSASRGHKMAGHGGPRFPGQSQLETGFEDGKNRSELEKRPSKEVVNSGQPRSVSQKQQEQQDRYLIFHNDRTIPIYKRNSALSSSVSGLLRQGCQVGDFIAENGYIWRFSKLFGDFLKN